MSDITPTPIQPEPHPYQKLGGWLLLFTIIPFIALPFGLFTQIRDLSQFSYTQDLAGILYLLGKAVYFVSLGLTLTGSVMVIRRKPMFLRVRQIGFLVAALQTNLTYAYTAVTTDDGLSALIGLMMIPMLLIMTPFLVYLFMLYYFRSVRVRTYMGSDEYLRLAFFTKLFLKKENIKPEEGDL